MKKIEINLGKGNIKYGFPSVLIAVFDNYGRKIAQKSGISLSQHNELANAFRDFEFLYEHFGDLSQRGIKIIGTGVTNVSESNFLEVCKNIEIHLNQWLLPIEKELPLYICDRKEKVRILIITDDDIVRRLPWNLWQLFDSYPHIETAISLTQFEYKPESRTPEGKVYILSILGNCDDLNLEPDRQTLAALPNSYIEWLIEPTREKLNEILWHKRGWDILFFAGHSYSLKETSSPKEQAVIQLNSEEQLNIKDLKHGLKTAIDNGLQLAIFNSCDGSGLAKSLQNLNIPQVIVMRQPIPDFVAQEFLKKFLTKFAKGESMYIAERKAREQLQGIEKNYPCASWLPAIFQNPAVVPLTWKQLSQSSSPLELPIPTDPKIPNPISLLSSTIATAIATISIITLRSLGLFQSLELQLYDHLMRTRPDEVIDPYITIVAATEKDVEEYGGYPLPDITIARAIAKIQTYQPEFIGLDIFRDRPQQPGNEELRQILDNDKSIVSICSLKGFNDPNRPGIAPPPNLEAYRIGFSEMALDSDNVVRRHLLSSQPMSGDVCQTEMSLSSRLALYYLDQQNIQPEIINQDIQIDRVRLKSLPKQIGGYQKLNDYGFQIMLNYRSGSKPFEVISLQELFTNHIEHNSIRGNIVLIGMDAPISTPDYHNTPQGKLPGVIIHAHKTSQLINAVLKQRPLIKTLLPWQENILISFGSILSGLIIWRFHSFFKFSIIILTVSLIFYIVSCLALNQGLWLPVLPVIITLFAPILIVYIYSLKPLQKAIKNRKL